TQKISKLVVISSSMKLRGILTYYDLISFLIAPKRKGRSGDREGNKPSFQKQHVKNFVKSYVLTLTPSNTLKEAVELILNKQIGSVLIVNKEKMPTSIITTRDLLTVLMKQKAPGKVEIAGDNLSKNSRQILGGFFDKLTHMSAHIKNVQKVRLFVREEKKGGVFEAMISLIPQKGPVHVIRKQGKNLKKLLAKLRIKKD
ncbi:MAG: CBS domain-containing protein, partial [Patescibacteria group bacterium]